MQAHIFDLDGPTGTVVVERGDVLRAKPGPDLFLACQERLGVATRDCYVAGDRSTSSGSHSGPADR